MRYDMTDFEYQTLIFPPNLVKTIDEFKEFVLIKEEGWETGLKNLLKICEREELYEYCTIIRDELEKYNLNN